MARINEQVLGLRTFGIGSEMGITIAGTSKAYDTIAQRDADSRPGMFAFVRNAASGDATVNSGFAVYYNKGGNWKKIFEEEAMDRDIAGGMSEAINWNRISNRPMRDPSDIERAVDQMHSHQNLSTLSKLSAVDRTLMYDGSAVKAEPTRYTKWLQLNRPITTNAPVRCKIWFFTNVEMTDLLKEIDSSGLDETDRNRFYYFSTTNNKKTFVRVVDGSIPESACGRFVIVDIADLNLSDTLYIYWKWIDVTTDETVSDGICVYPSITPSNTESIGLVWSETEP